MEDESTQSRKCKPARKSSRIEGGNDNSKGKAATNRTKLVS